MIREFQDVTAINEGILVGEGKKAAPVIGRAK